VRPLPISRMAYYAPNPPLEGFNATALPITLPRSKGMRDPSTGATMHVMVPTPTPARTP